GAERENRSHRLQRRGASAISNQPAIRTRWRWRLPAGRVPSAYSRTRHMHADKAETRASGNCRGLFQEEKESLRTGRSAAGNCPRAGHNSAGCFRRRWYLFSSPQKRSEPAISSPGYSRNNLTDQRCGSSSRIVRQNFLRDKNRLLLKAEVLTTL